MKEIGLRILRAQHACMALDEAGHLITGYPLAFLITTPGGLEFTMPEILAFLVI